MKKRIFNRWLLTALAAMTVFSAPAAKKTFTAVTSNVDGLPPNCPIKIAGVQVANPSMNPDGSQETGATRMGQLIAENLWDIVALSEDFNYHNYLINGVSTYYNVGAYRGIIDQSNLHGSLANYPSISTTNNKGLYMMTDGLGFLTRKKYQVTPTVDAEGEGNNWVRWESYYGVTDHESDGLIAKGFRFYQVVLEGNLVVDVYITHMEAGSSEGDIDSRNKQLKQFAEYIKSHKGNNPIIILGDTNCRYTRDAVKADFIDAINADPDLEIHDPWVDLMWDGVYPEFGAGAMMVSQYGEQRGEVVDKIFYINNAQSACTLTCEKYLHDDSFTYADGSQIADHYPVVGTFVIEGPDDPNGPTEVTIPDAPTKSGVVSGQTYYLRNLGSGKFLRAGGAWTSQAVMGDYPSKVTPTASGSGYTMKTTHQNGSGNNFINCTGTEYYMDQGSNVWTLTQVKDNVYRMKDASQNAVGYSGDILAPVTYNENDPNQQWEFLTEADLLHELYYATSDSPKDVTFLMKAPDFGYCDQEFSGWSSSQPNYTGSYVKREKTRLDAVNNVSFYKMYNTNGSAGDRSWTLSQTISGLPAGTYKVSYQVATYNMSDNQTFTINGSNASYIDLGNSDPGNETVARNLARGAYAQEFTVTVTNSGTYANKIEINVKKKDTTSATGSYFDTFNIKCIGLEGIPDLAMYERVKEAIDDAQSKADELGLGNNYRNNQVVTLWEEKEIVGDGWSEIKKTYKNLSEAVLTNKTIPADYTYALVNPSFELYPNYKDSRYNIYGAFPFGWSYPTEYTDDSGVWPASDQWKYTENPDGEYLFNTWREGDWGGNAVYQEVTLTPGLYQLSAKVASGEGNKVFLYAGDKNAHVITEGSSKFVPITLNFVVSDGKPFNIGVAGADGAENFTIRDGKWYKADDFHLTRIGDAETIQGMEMVQLAINQATDRAKALNSYDDAFAGKMAEYQAMIDNYTLSGDGTKEFNEIYDLLRVKVFAQPTQKDGKDIDVDYTYAIPNNSFEWGNTYGWNLLSTAGDTGVKENSNDTYKMSSCDGNYLFNTWQDANPLYRGTVISTKIPNLPAGHYKLQATFANDPGHYVFLEVKGQEGVASQKEMFTLAQDKDKGEIKYFEFEVGEGTPEITILAGGCNSDGTYDDFGGDWYKVDNFRLTRTGDPNICFFYMRLRDAIKEANEVASELPDKYSDQWDAQDYQDLIDGHLNDGHDPDAGETSSKYDPLKGGSGIEEINTLFQRLRDLIFSQTETGADMSGAITNNSFELGDLTGWTTYADPAADAKVTVGTEGTPTYGTQGTDGTYLYNAFYGDRLAHPIYQVIPNVPSGRYTLTVKIASDAGAKFFIGANAKHSDLITIPASGVEGVADEAVFHEYSFTFEVPVEAESKDVKIGIYPTGVSSAEEIGEAQFADDAVGPWYKVDHFRLKLESRYLDIAWTPETEDCGTIMLPFALDKAKYEESLGQYGFKAYYIDQLEKNETPADIERNLYRIIKLSEPLDELEANKPYLIIRDAEQTANVKKVKAAEGEEETSYSITGWSTNKEDLGEGEKNILLGSLTDYTFGYLHYHLQKDELGNIGFVLHDPNDKEDNTAHLEQYHACIQTALTPEGFAETDGLVMQSFYFVEPVQKWDVELEEGRYGTIVLPFDAEVPAGLRAVEMTGVTALRNSLNNSYQVAQLSDPVKTLEANVPYVVRSDDPSKTFFIFEGVAQNEHEEFSPEGNLLTGLFKSRDGQFYNEQKKRDKLEPGHWVLTHDDNNRAVFMKTTDEVELPAYSAYICNPDVVATLNLLAEGKEGEAAVPSADVIYLNEEHASETYEWEMETADYGTIILPINADVPEDLEAYELSAPADAPKNMPTQAEADKTYQLLTMTPATTLEANKTYLMVKKSADTEEPGTEETSPLAVKAAGSEVYTFKGAPNAILDAAATGVLTGAYEDKGVKEGDYLLNEGGKGFEKLGRAATVYSLHGYISQDGLTATPDYLLLVEPKADSTDSVQEILAGEENVDIYTLQGVRVAHDVVAAEGLRDLEPGIYIIRTQKSSVKVIKN
ncbi:MAG: hypothetical protein K2G53_06340 [Muribaculaceae bacterium]|nr:hypothetical protein [Muribaculaceae bacterium]